MTRDEYVSSVKTAFISLAKKAVMAKLAKEIPKLFIGKLGSVFNPLVGLLVDKVLTYAVLETETALFFAYIDMRTGKQSKKFEDAVAENYIAQQTGSADEKLKAEKKLKEAFIEFAVITN